MFCGFKNGKTLWSGVLLAGLFVCFLVFLGTRSGPKAAPAAVGAERTARPSPPPGYLPPADRANRAGLSATNQAGSAAVTFPFSRLLSPSATNYPGSMRALQALPAVLTSVQSDGLRDVLAAPYDPRMPVSLLEFNGVKNAAGDLLLKQPDLDPGLIFDFAAMAEDPGYDDVWRDYCLQMLGAGYGRLSGAAGDGPSGARSLALAVLRGAAESRERTWPGTALLGLHLISQADPSAVPAAEISGRAVAVASDASASEAARITALRLAGLRRARGVLPAARELAQTAGTETERAAAIATLGELGTADDMELLASLSADRDPFVSSAAKRAFEALGKSGAGGKAGGD